MPYTKSIARKEFESVVSAIRADAKYCSVKRNGIPHSIQQCVFRNSVFQCSAALEEYIKSLFEDWVHLLRLNNKTVSSIPVELVYWAAGKKQKTAFQHFIAFGDESKFISTLSASSGVAEIFDATTLVRDVIWEAEHVRDRKYPSKKNIKAIFTRFGIRNVFNEMQQKGHKDYKSILESFSDVRTSIAHEHPTPDITFNDLKSQFLKISDFVSKMDKVMFWHVCNVSGLDCWKTIRI